MSETTDAFLQTAIKAARAGGKVLHDWSGRFTVSEKSRANLVTEADFESQKTIYELISSRFANHSFLGEEGLNHDDSSTSYRWIIDPLDGTSNYVHRFPYYCVSIALEDEAGLLIGVVYDPNRDELFTAVRGQGARVHGSPLRTSACSPLSEAMVLASLPVGTSNTDPAVTRFLNMLPHAQTVQRTGSAALNLAYIAAGRIEAFWSSSLKPWDVAAGVLLVTEAGGKVTKMDGSTFELQVPDMLATNGTNIHEEMVPLLTNT